MAGRDEGRAREREAVAVLLIVALAVVAAALLHGIEIGGRRGIPRQHCQWTLDQGFACQPMEKAATWAR